MTNTWKALQLKWGGCDKARGSSPQITLASTSDMNVVYVKVLGSNPSWGCVDIGLILRSVPSTKALASIWTWSRGAVRWAGQCPPQGWLKGGEQVSLHRTRLMYKSAEVSLLATQHRKFWCFHAREVIWLHVPAFTVMDGAPSPAPYPGFLIHSCVQPQ